MCGDFDTDTQQVELHTEQKADLERLLNKYACRTTG